MNWLERFAEEMKNEQRAVYLYGAGFIADRITKLLKECGGVDGYIVDKRYLPVDKEKRIKNGRPVIAVDELDRDCVLIDAIQLVNTPVDLPQNRYIKKIYRLDFSTCFLHGVYEESFVLENMSKFMGLYDKLQDAESRVSLMNFISQKLTGSYSKPCSENTQYFDEDIFLPKENETFVDCGAYDGDSLLNFFTFLKKYNISTYKKCFAFEPDKENFEKLEKNVAAYPNISAYQLGTYYRKDSLHFSDGNDTGSSIQSSGGVIIEVDSIDNITNGEDVSYIKMDIEGAELDSLMGAQKTILKYRPKLAICVYHKTDDLLTIPNFILSLHNDYRLYLRNYKKAGCETVLYAM